MKLRLAGLFVVASIAAPLAQGGFPVPPAGTQSDAKPATGILLGRILDGATARPLAGATVTISPAPPTGTGATTPTVLKGPTRVMTASDGQFVFHSLPAGSFTINASKPGYVPGAYGRRFPTSSFGGAGQGIELADGERRTQLNVPLWKFGVIGGTVVDETGEPLIGVQVRVLRRTIVAGRAQYTQTGNMPSTDDRGVYRTASLAPGEYIAAVVSTSATVPAPAQEAYVQAMASGDAAAAARARDSSGGLVSSAAGVRVGDLLLQGGAQGPGSGVSSDGPRVVPPRENQPLLIYPTRYYPAASTASQAGVISVGAGEERSNVDFQLRPAPSVSVSGMVTGLDRTAANIGLQLLPAGIDTLSRDYSFETATTISDGTGRFTFLGVTPGQYTIRTLRAPSRPALTEGFSTVVQVGSSTIFSGGGVSALPPIPTEPTLWSDMPVSVGERNVEGVTVPLRSGARVSGQAEFIGTAERPLAARIQQMSVSIEGSDGRSPGPLSAGLQIRQGRLDGEGRLTSYQLPPGKYVIRIGVAPQGWTFAGAFLEGREITDQPFELEGTDVTGVSLRFTDQPAQLSGTVRQGQNAAATSTVLIFPTEPSAWTDYGPTPRRLRSAVADRDGSYRMTLVPDGNYYVVALPDDAPPNWLDPASLKRLSATATLVTIGPGEKKVQDLVVRR